ncbi:MAG: branched-chain amino acid transaminase [Candidatus Nanohaloarchaea archaeon]
MEEADLIWMDGEQVPWDEAEVHVLTHALHYGTGVFEGIRCYDTVDAVYGIDIPYDQDKIREAVLDLIRANGLDACYIRPIVFHGYGEMGVDPGGNPVRVAIAVWPWGAYLGEEALSNGVDVMTSSWRKYRGDMIPASAKTTGAYVNSMLATTEADEQGYREAILLDAGGNVAEGPGENVFLVRDGTLVTPGPASSILEGVTRDSVMRIARDHGREVVERPVSRGELYTADELFFTGTAAEVTPIRSVDDVEIGAGEITLDLQDAFFDVVDGSREEYADWLTWIQ